MHRTYAEIRAIVFTLSLHGETMQFSTLIEVLRARGMVCPSTGEPYRIERGIGRAIGATYRQTLALHGERAAESIALAFVDRNGRHPWAQ